MPDVIEQQGIRIFKVFVLFFSLLHGRLFAICDQGHVQYKQAFS